MKDKAFGNRLKYLRQKRGLVQTELAPLIGISYKAIQDHEGGRWPNQKNRQKYLDFYGCDEDWLLTGKGEPYNKGIDEGNRTADGEGLWGQTRHHDVDGKQIDVTLFTPPDSQSESSPPSPDPFAKGVGALRTIFDSHDPLLISTIRANLTTFEQAAIKHRQLHEQFIRIQKLEDKCKALQKKLNALEESMKAGDAGAGTAKTDTDAAE